MSDDFEALARLAFADESVQMLLQFEHSVQALTEAARLGKELRPHADAAFRAVHTLKGSAGIFGMTALVRFSHALESVLDRVREAQQPVDAALQRLLLGAHDAMQLLCGHDADPQQLPPQAEALLPELLALADAVVVEDPADALADVPVVAPTVAAAPVPALAASVAMPAAQPAVAARAGGPRLRVGAAQLDALIGHVAEASSAVALAHDAALRHGAGSLVDAVQQVQAAIGQAREQALGLRMVPLAEVCARFPRLVREAARQVGKEVELLLDIGDAEIDRELVEAVVDPLTHLVRNAVDHGLEPAEERVRHGKPARGHVLLSARREGGQIVIGVRDDGRGLDRERIRRRAIERGLITPQQRLNDAETLDLICQPGFSTAQAVTELSGRGVGMDVVRRHIEALRGELRLASEPGHGTLMQLRVPMTLALLDVFVLRVGTADYLLPLDAVQECLDAPAGLPQQALGSFAWRGEELACVDLAVLFGADPGARRRHRSLVLVRAGGSHLGLLVDRVCGQQQVVLRPLGPLLAALRIYAGAAVLASGTLASLIDPAALHALLRRGVPERRPENSPDTTPSST